MNWRHMISQKPSQLSFVLHKALHTHTNIHTNLGHKYTDRRAQTGPGAHTHTLSSVIRTAEVQAWYQTTASSGTMVQPPLSEKRA